MCFWQTKFSTTTNNSLYRNKFCWKDPSELRVFKCNFAGVKSAFLFLSFLGMEFRSARILAQSGMTASVMDRYMYKYLLIFSVCLYLKNCTSGANTCACIYMCAHY